MAGKRLSGKEREDLMDEIRQLVAKVYPNRNRPFNPLMEIALIAANPNLPASTTYKANVELAQYFFAKPKAIETEPEAERNISIQIMQFPGAGVEARIVEEKAHAPVAEPPKPLVDRAPKAVAEDGSDGDPDAPSAPGELPPAQSVKFLELDDSNPQ